jgi:hypothetical protein
MPDAQRLAFGDEEAAVYWISMNPLLSPLSGTRNGGRPLEVFGSRSRYGDAGR